MLGTNLLQVVEYVRTSGKLFSCINSTFIALILNKDFHVSFDDFRPIALYNCLYKIIAKFNVVHLKLIITSSIIVE
jgi:hypothetical protein